MLESVGAPRHTNRLIHETSPYLLQHAHNPVDWYPWGVDAFTAARTSDRPVLLSVGYSACHWCHVMAHESFEDQGTAALMNELYINIKVDREERPDVDDVYMNAVQLMTQHGGWPMTVFLTPEGEPFYGGTYFPPVDRHGMPSFSTVLQSVASAYRSRREELLGHARGLVEHIRSMSAVSGSGALDPGLLQQSFEAIARGFDARDGGFGFAPKFPSTMSLSLCLRRYGATGDKDALRIVTHSLERMRRGGIHDHLGGGFHRYSVDNRWLVPHFEKMLYDNAQLCRLFTEVWQATGEERARGTAESILGWVRREMTQPGGGYYSTQDADSEGVEGKFYVWTPEEIRDELGDGAEQFAAIYNVTGSGNFEHGASILNLLETGDAGLSREAEFAAARQTLWRKREQRIKPQRDDKVLVAWNGLMLAAQAFAARALGSSVDLAAAVATGSFLWSELRRDGRLLHGYKDGHARHGAFLDDVAALGLGYIELYQATFEGRWLGAAFELAEALLERFEDRDEGGFFYTASDAEKLIARSKNPYDNAVPSGNSQAVHLLLRLHALTGDTRYEESAERALMAFRELMRRAPQGFAHMLEAADARWAGFRQIVIAGDPESPLTRALVDRAFSGYDPNRLVVLAQGAPAELDKLVAGKSTIDGQPVAYVCERFTCQRPAMSPDELSLQLAKTSKM